jgi:hypothetical protein
MTNTGVPLQEFTLFPKLPTELRLEIWRYCRPEGRFVEFAIPTGERILPRDPDLPPRSVPPSFDTYYRLCWDQTEAYYGTTEATKDFSLLQVCKEARAVALKTFRPILGSLLLNKCPFLFDFERDTFRIIDSTNSEELFGMPNTYRVARQLEGPKLSENQQKELKEFSGSVKHLELRRCLIFRDLEPAIGEIYNFKSLRTFRAEIELLYADDEPRIEEYHQWLEGSTQTRWEKIEESRLPWFRESSPTCIIYKATWVNTGVAKA